MIWRLRKQFRQFFRRYLGSSDYEKTLLSHGKKHFAYYVFAWTLSSIAFMHFLFCYRDPETGAWVLVQPSDTKYIGLPGYEVNAYAIENNKVIAKKIKSAVDDDD